MRGKLKSADTARPVTRSTYHQVRLVISVTTECLEMYSSGNKLTDVLAISYLDSIGDNSFYALKYIVAEILCLLTAILQILLTNKVTA